MKKERLFIFSILALALFFAMYFPYTIQAQQDTLQSMDTVNQLESNEIREKQIIFTNIFENPQNSGIIIIDHLNEIVKEIAAESSIYDLIGFSVGMVVYGIFIYHFYRFLSKRDLFSINLEQRIAHGKLKSTGEKISAAPRIIGYIATNFFLFPFVVFLWF